jgi:glycosyltransferase involved in cell wall biosynthesis
MKIVHLISYFQPQLGYEEFYLSSNQIKNGHKVYIVTSDKYFPFPHYNDIYFNILGKRTGLNKGLNLEYAIPTIRLESYFEFRTILLFKNLNKILNKIDPDIIHVHEFLLPILFQIIMKSNIHSKIIVDCHTTPLLILSEKFYVLKLIYLKIHKFFFHLFMKKRKFFAYVTKESVFDFIKKNYRIIPKIIPLGVDLDKFNPTNYNNILIRKEMNIDINGFVLFYSGKIIPNKGLEILIKTFNILGEKHNVYLLFIGNGPENYSKVLENKINLKLLQNFKKINFVDHNVLPKYMAIANLGLWLGSIASASINEFIAMGKPVAVKIFEGYNLEKKGYKFAKQYKNILDLLTWIKMLINDQKYYQTICEEAENFAKNELDWNVKTKELLKIYNE